nr:hypothetical protein [Tanacetum cinerariifolium]
MSIYDFMTLPSRGDAKGTLVPLPTSEEIVVGQPDYKLAKKSKALVKQKASTSLAIPSGSAQTTKKKRLRKKASEARSSALVLEQTDDVEDTDISKFCVELEDSMEKDEGVVVVGFLGKVGAKSIHRQLDPLDMLARNALALDEECDQILEENRELRSLNDSSSEEFKNLRNKLALKISKSQEYRYVVMVAEHRFDVLKDEVTRFVGFGVECLICRLLSSDEFNSALARVLYLGITSSVERGLRIGRTDAAFEEAAQNVSNFFVSAQAEFDKVVAAFPSTNFPFLSKVVVAAVGSLLEVVNIQPDKIVCSATPSSVPATPLSANEALSPSSTPKDSQHALDV